MDIIAKFNWVDVLVIIILFRVSYVAFQDGLSHEIFPLIGAICTLVLSLHFYHSIAVGIQQNVVKLSVALLDFISFVLLIVAIGLIFKLLRVVVDKVIKVTWHPLVEKFGGLLVGIMRAAVVASVILTVLALMPFPYLQRSIRDRSLTAMYFLRIGPSVYGKVSGALPTIKLESSSADREDIVKDLVEDKKIAADMVSELSRP